MAVVQFRSQDLDRLRDGRSDIEGVLAFYMREWTRSVSTTRLPAYITADAHAAAREQQQTELEQLKSETLGALDSVRQTFHRRRDAVLAAIERQIQPPPPMDSAAALLHEQQEMRAWQRCKPQLDRCAGGDTALTRAVELMRAAASHGDAATVGALRAEMPAYLEGRGSTDLAATALEELDAAMAHARPDVAGLIELRGQVKRGVEWLLTAVNYAEYAVQRRDVSVMLLGYDGSVKTFSVGPVDVPTSLR